MSKNLLAGYARKHRRSLGSIRRDTEALVKRLYEVLGACPTHTKATEVLRGIDTEIADTDRKIAAHME